jgi:glutathionylspermidine synthase
MLHLRRGLEGANVLLRMRGQRFETDGAYGEMEFVYQEVCLPPCMDGHYPVIGSWIARDEAAGMGVRESELPITRNTSRFVPDWFE